MPQALISSWLNKPKQNVVVISRSDASVAGTKGAQNDSSGPISVREGLNRIPKYSEQDAERERGTCQSEGIIESANAESENEVITIKLHSPKQSDETPQNLHPQISLHPLNEQTIAAFKVLNTILPIAYSERFYSETLTCPAVAALTMVAMWSPASSDSSVTAEQRPSRSDDHNAVSRIHGPDILISAIRCRLLRPKPDQPTSSVLPVNGSTPLTEELHLRENDTRKPTLYICTLATKPSYRSYGAATALLELSIRRARQSFGVCAVEAHVWDGHKDALEWYLRRGFVIVKRMEGYYRRLRPDAAVLVRKVLDRSIVTSDEKV